VLRTWPFLVAVYANQTTTPLSADNCSAEQAEWWCDGGDGRERHQPIADRSIEQAVAIRIGLSDIRARHTTAQGSRDGRRQELVAEAHQ
jgi:hypothetical protein